MGVVKDFKHLVVLRALIGTKTLQWSASIKKDRTLTATGCVESGFAPGVLLVISSWYKKTEQSKRFGVYISAAVLSGAFGGLIAAGIVGGLEGAHGIRGWRWLFIVEGAATVGFALISFFILPDFPATTKRLSARERHIAIARLESDNVTAMTEDGERLSPWQAVLGSVKDWRTWMFVIGYMVIRFTLSPILHNTDGSSGYCWCQHAFLLLPDSGQRSFRRRLHHENQLPYNPHLCSGICLYRHHSIFQ